MTGRRRVARAASIIGICGVLSLAAVVGADAESPEPQQVGEGIEGAEAGGDGAAGLRVYVDPATGELTSQPLPEQVELLSKALAEALSRSTAGLEPFPLARGGRGVHLQGRFQHALRVAVGPGGELVPLCVDRPHRDPTQVLATPQPAEK